MKILTAVLLTIIILLSSCASFKPSRNIRMQETESGRKTITCKNESFSIQYYGDYTFHGLNKNEALYWNKNFAHALHTRKTKFLYCGHTTLNPYCATAGLLYKNAELNSTVEEVVQDLKKIHAVELTQAPKSIGRYVFTKLSYRITNSKLNVETNHLEYFGIEGRNIVRIVFWTMESDLEWFEKETEGILETWKVEG